MKIVHLIAGAGPMYCGSCMHGNTLAAALRKAGANVVLAPVYTPLRTDEENVSIDRLAMGGINVYLDETLPLWRWMPGFLRRQLDRPSLVSWVARRGSSTRPEQLGRLAVAMFQGEEGPLQGEIEGLIQWLGAEVRPDIIHLSNVMLAGLARPLWKHLGVPTIATLSGEDTFLEKLPAPYYDQARADLRARAADLTGLVAMSKWYADFMAEYLSVPREKIDVIRPGLNLEGFGGNAECGMRNAEGPIDAHAASLSPSGMSPHPDPLPEGEGESRSHSNPIPQREGTRLKTIGFLSRICPDKGLHLLVEALETMYTAGKLPPCRLRVAGYLDASNRAYLDKVRKRLASWAAAGRFEYVGELDRASKIAFLQSIDILCLPSLIHESKGLPVLEAWAGGVPVVVPDRGAFTELVADTEGGLLYDPQRPGALAEALCWMLSDESFAEACGERGRRAVHQRYTAQRESREMLAFYERLCRLPAQPPLEPNQAPTAGTHPA